MEGLKKSTLRFRSPDGYGSKISHRGLQVFSPSPFTRVPLAVPSFDPHPDEEDYQNTQDRSFTDLSPGAKMVIG